VTVKDGATTLAMGEDEDYTVSYTNNTNAGTATVTVAVSDEAAAVTWSFTARKCTPA